MDIKIPSVGESITSGILGTWHKKSGDWVKEGDVLFEIETDKVTSEVYAPCSGKLEQLVSQGTEVQVGQVVGKIDEKAQAPKETTETKPSTSNAAAKSASATASSVSLGKETSSTSSPTPLSPAVRRLVDEHQISPAEIEGTGKGGRILKGDIITHLEEEKGVTSTRPNGNGGTPGLPSAEKRTTRRKMTPLRKRIADRLVSAQRTAAILTTFNEVDMSNVMQLRAKVQDRFVAKHGIKLGFMSFFVKAALYALKTVPALNAQIEGDEIVENHFYDIGVAIGTEKGLIVPVIRNIDQLSFAGVEKAIAEFAQKGRAGKITLEDLQGGVFTISNGGVYGSMLSTPILNPPQSGILGMHTIQERPVAINGRVEIRPMMYLALSYDHRLVDGKEAVTFLSHIKEMIENPSIALLEL